MEIAFFGIGILLGGIVGSWLAWLTGYSAGRKSVRFKSELEGVQVQRCRKCQTALRADWPASPWAGGGPDICRDCTAKGE